jgi:hypothetical protein
MMAAPAQYRHSVNAIARNTMTTYTIPRGGSEGRGNSLSIVAKVLRSAMLAIGASAARALTEWQSVQQARAEQRIQAYLVDLERIEPELVADYRAWAQTQDSQDSATRH